jgi:hypothetical protein
MAANLNEFLATHKPKGFKSVPHYFASGDYLTFYFRDERCHAKRVDDVLTVYRSMESGDVVGCEINGVRKILEAARSFGVDLKAGKVTLGFLFLVGLTLAKDDAQRQPYYDLKDIVKDVAINELHLA